MNGDLMLRRLDRPWPSTTLRNVPRVHSARERTRPSVELPQDLNDNLSRRSWNRAMAWGQGRLCRGWRRASRCKKKSLTGDIVRPGVLVEARPFYIPKDGNEDGQVTTIRGSNAASDTGPSSRPRLHSSRIRRNPALPTGKTVLPEKHSMAGSFGVGLWRTKTPSWAD